MITKLEIVVEGNDDAEAMDVVKAIQEFAESRYGLSTVCNLDTTEENWDPDLQQLREGVKLCIRAGLEENKRAFASASIACLLLLGKLTDTYGKNLERMEIPKNYFEGLSRDELLEHMLGPIYAAGERVRKSVENE